MEFDPVLLARIQFAFTISFHIIFPAFTIGLSAFITVLLLLWLRSDNEKFHRLARFWTKIFAVSFAMGVAAARRDRWRSPPRWRSSQRGR